MTDRSLNQCPPKIALEAYFLEGREIAGSGLKGHVEACPACAGTLASMESERSDFLRRYPFPRLLEEVAPRRKSPWRRILESVLENLWAPRPFAAVLAMAGLAGILLVTLRPEGPADPLIQVKGGVGLSFYVSTTPQGKVDPGADGMGLPAGARLQFVYSNAESPYLYLVGLEEDGTLTAYYPDRGLSSAPVQTGSKIKLPQAVSWEPKSGYERFYALFSKEPVPIAQVRSAAAQLEAEGKTVERSARLPLPYPQASILVHRKNGK